MWLARCYAGLTLREIGVDAGGKDDAAVSVAIRCFVDRAKDDPTLSRLRRQAEKVLNVEMSPPMSPARRMIENPCRL